MRIKTDALPIFPVLALLLLSAGSPALAGSKFFTEEDVQQFLRNTKELDKSHSAMSQQGERIEAILKGFLSGDVATIQSEADGILKDMREVLQEYAPAGKEGSVAWKTVTQIVNETQLMKEKLLKEDFNAAYLHFFSVPVQCIQCHQVLRRWGKFNVPKDSSKKDGQRMPSKSK